MSELILTHEEEEMKIMEAPDKVLADCVRKAYSVMHTLDENGSKPILFTAAQHMCVFQAMEANAGKATYNIEGLSYQGEPLGDWQVLICRMDSNAIEIVPKGTMEKVRSYLLEMSQLMKAMGIQGSTNADDLLSTLNAGGKGE